MTDPGVDERTARELAKAMREVFQAAAHLMTHDDTPLLRMITDHIGHPVSRLRLRLTRPAPDYPA